MRPLKEHVVHKLAGGLYKGEGLPPLLGFPAPQPGSVGWDHPRTEQEYWAAIAPSHMARGGL